MRKCGVIDRMFDYDRITHGEELKGFDSLNFMI